MATGLEVLAGINAADKVVGGMLTSAARLAGQCVEAINNVRGEQSTLSTELPRELQQLSKELDLYSEMIKVAATCPPRVVGAGLRAAVDLAVVAIDGVRTSMLRAHTELTKYHGKDMHLLQLLQGVVGCKLLITTRFIAPFGQDVPINSDAWRAEAGVAEQILFKHVEAAAQVPPESWIAVEEATMLVKGRDFVPMRIAKAGNRIASHLDAGYDLQDAISHYSLVASDFWNSHPGVRHTFMDELIHAARLDLKARIEDDYLDQDRLQTLLVWALFPPSAPVLDTGMEELVDQADTAKLRDAEALQQDHCVELVKQHLLVKENIQKQSRWFLLHSIQHKKDVQAPEKLQVSRPGCCVVIG
ncbi:hypothetical protein WJX72_008836 [[Myrmecia] bisecta]|uniref:Uncharacterized protein n=1 Tax=[Myrmecia] bisecta TaxID=41462 RepID=A0AAW1Q0V8_9CHLO